MAVKVLTHLFKTLGLPFIGFTGKKCCKTDYVATPPATTLNAFSEISDFLKMKCKMFVVARSKDTSFSHLSF